MLVNEIEQPHPIQNEHTGILARDRSGGPGAAVKKRELADNVSLLVFRENDLLTLSALDKELHPAAAQDKDLSAGITVVEDGLAALELATAHHLGQGFALLVVKQAKDGDFANHAHGCGHFRFAPLPNAHEHRAETGCSGRSWQRSLPRYAVQAA